jgi:hypothetical protein
MVAILLTMGKEAELPIGAYSWFLQKGRLVGPTYCNRIKFKCQSSFAQKAVCFFFFELSSLLCKCCKCMESQCSS